MLAGCIAGPGDIYGGLVANVAAIVEHRIHIRLSLYIPPLSGSRASKVLQSEIVADP
jgi:hypothetical protein